MASEKVTAMIEEVKALSVLELAELVHALEETFGVSAAAAAAPAAAAAAAAAFTTLKAVLVYECFLLTGFISVNIWLSCCSSNIPERSIIVHICC